MYSKVSNKDMIKAVKHLVNAGYKPADIEAYVMMGLPGQELDEIIASIFFVHNLGVKVRLASFSPIQGTKEFQRSVEMEFIDANVDPLLTNKSIFPLQNNKITYEKISSHGQKCKKTIFCFSRKTRCIGKRIIPICTCASPARLNKLIKSE